MAMQTRNSKPALDQAHVWLNLRRAGITAAEEILRFTNEIPMFGSPVRLDSLFAKLNIDVMQPGPTSTLKADGAAWATEHPPRAQVIVRQQARGIDEQRITAAHEFGHIMLHQLGRIYQENGSGTGIEAKLEADANEFALKLLMPGSSISSYINEYRSMMLVDLSELVARQMEVPLMDAIKRLSRFMHGDW